jgi:class 3 adenylate cyclase
MSSGDAERRQITIMFCDLVNSAKLSGQLDPEDLRDVIGAYQQACAESIRRYDGFVARYVGDGLLICFGYPIAHEDDAERSVRAGFEVIDAVSSLNEKLGALPEMKLRVRVGIATGLVVVGDLIADGVLDKDAIVGEAANLAARLQEMASPNSIIVSSNTRRLAADRFDYRDLGIRGIKGFAKPLPVYQVTGERRVTRFEARNAALTTLVDRHEEMATLLRAWKDAESGSGRVVILCGEAGIGKSRIAAELYNRISGTSQRPNEGGASPLTFQCSPYHANAPLYPVIRYIEQLAGIDRLDSSAQRLGKLQAVMGSGSDDDKILPLIGELLDLDPDLGAPVPAVGAAAKRYLTIEALLEWCAARVRNGVPVITFEDAHWIDPTSTLLLNELVKWVRGQSVILIITLRTSGTLNAARFVEETLARNSNTSHVTICEVQDLDEGDTRQLVVATAGDRTLSQSQFDDIIAKSAGIPLYVEELAKAVIHGIPLSPTRDDSDQMEGGVPNTIRDALMAHLDQLGDAKQAAQFASVIGPEFSLDVLAKIMRRPPADLIAQLENLIRLRIVVPVVHGSHLYRFRHSLFRDISYRSLLRRRRRQLHLVIAEEYAQQEAESLNASSDLIAQHYSLGEAHLEAIVH